MPACCPGARAEPPARHPRSSPPGSGWTARCPSPIARARRNSPNRTDGVRRMPAPPVGRCRLAPLPRIVPAPNRPCPESPLPRIAPAPNRPCPESPLPRIAPAPNRPCPESPLPRIAPAPNRLCVPVLRSARAVRTALRRRTAIRGSSPCRRVASPGAAWGGRFSAPQIDPPRGPPARFQSPASRGARAPASRRARVAGPRPGMRRDGHRGEEDPGSWAGAGGMKETDRE